MRWLLPVALVLLPTFAGAQSLGEAAQKERERRKKLATASSGRNYIETVWGRGYVLREPAPSEDRITA